MLLKHLVKHLVVLMTFTAASTAQDGPAPPAWPGRGQLYIGACYQPVDRSPEQIDSDIAVMKNAGFNVVRMGDLSWDSFEPSQGKFTFEWFDKIMDKMQSNGIRVILARPWTALCGHLLSAGRPLARANRQGHRRHEECRIQ